ncbi:DNA repair protein rhp54 [Hordeum vulgare]|nr:DNA repair protein rhp54 [Hordeum vulgare]
MENARDLFDGMPTAKDEANRVLMEGLIFKGGGRGIPYDPDEMQSQDGMVYSFGEGIPDPLWRTNSAWATLFRLITSSRKTMAFNEEDDEVDIDREPLFDELPAQANAKNNKLKSKRTKAYTQNEDKLLCDCWRDIGQDPKIGSEQKASTFWQIVHHEFHEHKKVFQALKALKVHYKASLSPHSLLDDHQ